MSGWLRRAGHLAAPAGDILWSVAEGRRGRRWRSLRRDGAGAIVSDLLLELDPAGRWQRLEYATATGILTLHPEGEAVHGNVVTVGGMRHVAMPWTQESWLSVADEPVAAVALAVTNAGAGRHGLLVRVDVEVEAIEGGPPDGPSAGDLPGPSWPLEA